MKKLFVSLVALAVATMSYAQSTLLATLSHDGNISAFYGASALQSAVAAAESGDVIILSSGQFDAADIDKPITLRGSGMSASTDSVHYRDATIIQGELTINIADTLNKRLVMEGLYFNEKITCVGILKDAQFLKCRFLSFIAGSNAVIANTSFIHCRFYDGYMQQANSNTLFINSLVCSPSCPSSSSVEFDNCFVRFDYYSPYVNYANGVNNAYYKNCIIQATSGSNMYDVIPSNCNAYNCIGLGQNRIFDSIKSKNTTNKYVSDITKVFKTYSATNNNTFINDSWSFELTDEAAATYLGTDGTQVGVYGGNLVYNENPTIPQITKCIVAPKSTADGKLSVDIEVRAAE